MDVPDKHPPTVYCIKCHWPLRTPATTCPNCAQPLDRNLRRTYLSFKPRSFIWLFPGVMILWVNLPADEFLVMAMVVAPMIVIQLYRGAAWDRMWRESTFRSISPVAYWLGMFFQLGVLGLLCWMGSG